MAKIIDGASGQNNIEVKLKHRRARCLLFYLQGDTSKLGQPNDQTSNKAVQDLIRRGVARYDFLSPLHNVVNEIPPASKKENDFRRKNETVPVMSLHEFADVVGNVVKSV